MIIYLQFTYIDSKFINKFIRRVDPYHVKYPDCTSSTSDIVDKLQGSII